MKLNHLDLQVADVQRTVAFFEQLFEMTLQTNRSSPALAILHDAEGFSLVLQRKEHTPYPPDFHLGFLVDSIETVRAVRARAQAAGFPVSDVIENGRGTLVYCRAPEGYSVEVSCRRG